MNTGYSPQTQCWNDAERKPMASQPAIASPKEEPDRAIQECVENRYSMEREYREKVARLEAEFREDSYRREFGIPAPRKPEETLPSLEFAPAFQQDERCRVQYNLYKLEGEVFTLGVCLDAMQKTMDTLKHPQPFTKSTEKHFNEKGHPFERFLGAAMICIIVSLIIMFFAFLLSRLLMLHIDVFRPIALVSLPLALLCGIVSFLKEKAEYQTKYKKRQENNLQWHEKQENLRMYGEECLYNAIDAKRKQLRETQAEINSAKAQGYARTHVKKEYQSILIMSQLVYYYSKGWPFDKDGNIDPNCPLAGEIKEDKVILNADGLNALRNQSLEETPERLHELWRFLKNTEQVSSDMENALQSAVMHLSYMLKAQETNLWNLAKGKRLRPAPSELVDIQFIDARVKERLRICHGLKSAIDPLWLVSSDGYSE